MLIFARAGGRFPMRPAGISAVCHRAPSMRTLAAAILDRLWHRSVVLNIRGRSYRLQDLEKLRK